MAQELGTPTHHYWYDEAIYHRRPIAGGLTERWTEHRVWVPIAVPTLLPTAQQLQSEANRRAVLGR